MSADLIEDAIDCLRGEGWDNEADAVAGLVAEIKRLRADLEWVHNEFVGQLATKDTEIRRLQEPPQEPDWISDWKDIEHGFAVSAKKWMIAYQKAQNSWIVRQQQNKALEEMLAAKDAANNDLMANCNQLRDRCWKAEGELARWQEIAIDEKATLLSFAAMISPPMPDELIEFYMKKAKENKDKKRSIAAKELDLQLLQPDDNLTIAYMLGGKKADERLEALQGYVARLEKAYLADSMQSEELARAALNKIREGK